MEKLHNLDIGLLILRLSLGILLLMHGIAKLFNGIGGIERMLEQSGFPEFLSYGVYLGEVLAPILLIVGFKVRLASILYMGTMVMAVLLAHPADFFSLSKSGGWAIELQALYFFGALVLSFTGGGNIAASRSNR